MTKGQEPTELNIVDAVEARLKKAKEFAGSTGYFEADYFDTVGDLKKLVLYARTLNSQAQQDRATIIDLEHDAIALKSAIDIIGFGKEQAEKRVKELINQNERIASRR